MIYYFLIQRIKTHKRLELLLKREVVEGFTILELLTVIAIVGALSAILLPYTFCNLLIKMEYITFTREFIHFEQC